MPVSVEDIRFLLVPPSIPQFLDLGVAIPVGTKIIEANETFEDGLHWPKALLTDFNDAVLVDRIRANFANEAGKSPNLIGAKGLWTVYLITSSDDILKNWEKIQPNLNVDFRIAVVRIHQ